MIQKNNAFILKRFDWGETSIIATFFSEDLGKMDGILKAARINSLRFRSSFDIFSYNEIVYYKKKSGLNLVVECYLKNNYPNIRKNIEADTTAKYLTYLILQLLPKEENNNEIFYFFLDVISSLEENPLDYERISRLFELHLLSMCGFRPHIESCIGCQKIVSEQAKFSLRLGGLLCKDCLKYDPNAQEILKGTLASMKYIQKHNWDLSMKLRLEEKINNELKFILKNFLEFHVEKRLKTSIFQPQTYQMHKGGAICVS